jgi:hypothetical protein
MSVQPKQFYEFGPYRIDRALSRLLRGGTPVLQGHAFASALTAETYRLDGQLDLATTFLDRGLDVATRAEYWYAVGFAQRVSGRIARDRGCAVEAAAAFDRALRTFERIGGTFEAGGTRLERAGLTGCVAEASRGGPAPSDAV